MPEPAHIPPDARKVCAGCRTVNLPASAYCYRCGLKLPDRLYTRGEVAGSPAGFWIRLLASLIDELVIVFTGVLLAVTVTGVEVEQAFKELAGLETGWMTTLLMNGFGVLYYTLVVGQRGQTLGKAVLGLKVTRADGSRISYGRSFARYWAYLASALPFGLGFIAIGLSSQKRGWHDFICNTRVVNLRR